jgi:SIR2-like domain
MISWPDALVREIARRRCVLFLGSGVSAAARSDDGRSPPTWSEFLTLALSLIKDQTLKTEVQKLISHKRLLLALQIIKSNVDVADYRSLLDRSFNDPIFKPARLHDEILALDSRVVITTNFDKIYERLCLATSSVGYKTIPYYSGDLADELRSDTSLIIKAHGTIDSISQMVFTKDEYHAAKSKYPRFYETLRAIFLTHTAVFIGCGMDDPDILLMLEDVKITATGARPHYALMRVGQQSIHERRDLLSSYNVSSIEYEPDHEALVPELGALNSQVAGLRSANPL